MKIAFVYDWVDKFGGAERVLLALHEIWPGAPLWTSVYDPGKSVWADVFEVKPSFLRYLPLIKNKHELLPFIIPIAFESFNFDNFDVVLSVTSADAKAIITKPDTLHICYCLTPTRYLWSGYESYLKEPGLGFTSFLAGIALKYSASSLRKWDFIASRRPDKYLSISKTVQKRIDKYYQKDSKVIYPGIDLSLFKPANKNTVKKDFFLLVSRFVSYKKIDYAIKSFNDLGWKLVIIGNGSDEKRLRKLSKRNISFICENLTDKKLCWYYQNCMALILPGEEDFGLTVIEAQACGKPVIAYGKGGVLEIVKQGITGELYSYQNQLSLTQTLLLFKQKKYSVESCRNNSLRFSKIVFQKKMRKTIEEHWRYWKKTR
ncbi:hypothetical protein A2Y99_03820 [Candidatus Gottesmanbacteria bacterium RBG_13_37_7]|uniref:Glycosyl transferase family 1 domain-containing protein n=1 Tax=Candidatus Gottesmanbacteria bacterium RBG_13_37_7 TaxID=1798369 RepID=A0A1F5YFZ0_9BACT|nr:MAG: hypothetical protein A2Y99_03820 [Candidatus Gottesmanbacteria bacterium RBG_13_37_7]